MSDDSKAIFKFTRDGQLYEVFEQGFVKVTPSPYPPNAQIIVNRIPQRILEVGQRIMELARAST